MTAYGQPSFGIDGQADFLRQMAFHPSAISIWRLMRQNASALV
jgi:hypothetical protein